MKMESKELMIGNLMNYKYWNPEPNNERFLFEQVEVIGYLKNQVYFKFKGRNEVNKIDQLFPIPLTEDWLLKLGWKKDFESDKVRSYVNERFDIGNINYSIKNKIFYFNCWENSIAPQYVHQLQNLFFTLTWERLMP